MIKFSDHINCIKNIYFDFQHSKIVISDGMPRSGSTLLYTMILSVLEAEYGSEKIQGRWVFDRKSINSKITYTIIKIHNKPFYIKYFSDFRFYSYRNIIDCLKSSKIFFGSKIDKALIDDYINSYQNAKKNNYLMFSYEQILNETDLCFSKISNHLKIPLKKKDFIKLYKKKIIHNEQYNNSKNNLFHKNHITNSQKSSQNLSIDLIKYIKSKYSWWFEETGYAITKIENFNDIN